MRNRDEEDRKVAIERYRESESVSAICASLGYSRDWFYRWLRRYEAGDREWFKEHSRRPNHQPLRTAGEIEEIVKLIRTSLHNRAEFCGAQAIRWEMEEQGVRPLPSIRTINRILARNELTHRRTGRYESKGKPYPKLVAHQPGVVHQSDFVGPCFLRGGLRFYGLNSVDVATGRCATEPTPNRQAQATLNAFWSSWCRLGMPRHQQVDNEMVFYGSLRYPRAMGPLIRLCLLHEIELWFIPMAEPWRNGVVEKFNDLWQQKFLNRVELNSKGELHTQCLRFEERHNQRYRYSKLNGRTPAESLRASGIRIRTPPQRRAPQHPLPKPQHGRYHLVRFVRSDGVLNVFGEKFTAPPETVYEYVRLTVDVAQQKLQVFLDQQIVDEHRYGPQ